MKETAIAVDSEKWGFRGKGQGERRGVKKSPPVLWKKFPPLIEKNIPLFIKKIPLD